MDVFYFFMKKYKLWEQISLGEELQMSVQEQ